MRKLLISRVLIIIGFLIGLVSWSYTVRHINDPLYLLPPEFQYGQTHAWYHAFRESIGDLAAMAIIIYIYFGAEKLRTPATWVICLILMFGYYAPFWIGMPFVPELSAPSLIAELIHILMALFATLGLFISRSVFHNSR